MPVKEPVKRSREYSKNSRKKVPLKRLNIWMQEKIVKL